MVFQTLFFVQLKYVLKIKKRKTESKMENPTHAFRETNIVPQLIYKKEKKVHFL